MNFTAPVKEDTELENSDSNHLRKDILVNKESRLLVLIFNVGSTLIFFFFNGGLYFGLMVVSFWTMGRVASDIMSMRVWVAPIVSFKLMTREG